LHLLPRSDRTARRVGAVAGRFPRVIDVDGVTVPRALVTELAHRLVYRGELKTANHLLSGLASDTPITLGEDEREVVRVALEEPLAGLEPLREALLGPRSLESEPLPSRIDERP
jgi:hypothetical protein